MKSHWEKIYAEKGAVGVSWFEASPDMSLQRIAASGIQKTDAVIDAGGGASRLADGLLEAGYGDVTVLDISGAALAVSKQRLGPRASSVKWIEGDVTETELQQRYALWHDRAVFHFLTGPDQRRKYLSVLRGALLPRGHLVMAAFAEDGPEKCSGLDIVRYSPEALQAELGGGFELVETARETHRTPFHTEQKFLWCRFRLGANFC